MTLASNRKLSVEQLTGDFEAVALAEVGAEGAEALPVTMTDIATSADWAYNATTEDNGTVGILDDEAGLTYSGPGTNHFRVKVSNLILDEHATPPEATDTVAIALYKNSGVLDYFDEGFVAQSEAELSFNIDTVVTLNEGDVLRFVLVGGGKLEATADWIVTEGAEIAIT